MTDFQCPKKFSWETLIKVHTHKLWSPFFILITSSLGGLAKDLQLFISMCC